MDRIMLNILTIGVVLQFLKTSIFNKASQPTPNLMSPSNWSFEFKACEKAFCKLNEKKKNRAEGKLHYANRCNSSWPKRSPDHAAFPKQPPRAITYHPCQLVQAATLVIIV